MYRTKGVYSISKKAIEKSTTFVTFTEQSKVCNAAALSLACENGDEDNIKTFMTTPCK
jgi:hypothetical protein